MYINNHKVTLPNSYISLDDDCSKLYISTFKGKIFKKLLGFNNIAVSENKKIVDFFYENISEISNYNSQSSLIIITHTSPNISVYFDSISKKISRKMKLKNYIILGSSSNRCVSFFDAMRIAFIYFKRKLIDHALIITGDIAFTKELRVINDVAITGDAVSSILFSAEGKCNQLVDYKTITKGEFSSGVWLKGEDKIFYEKNYIPTMKELLYSLISENNLSLEKIRWIIPHNVNKNSWINFLNNIEFPQSKVVLENTSKYGHCFASDLIINFRTINHTLQPGDYYILISVGLGGVFGAALFKY